MSAAADVVATHEPLVEPLVDAVAVTPATPDRPVAAATSTRLRSNRPFAIVLVGQTVSALGDAIAITALPLIVLGLTGSGALMGIVGALSLLPSLAMGLVAGALADRWDRRRMMLVADAGQAVLSALVPISLLLGGPTVAVILVVVLPINILRVAGAAGFTSVMPALVGKDQVGRASGYLEASLSVSFIVGPLLAGVLLVSVGGAATLAIDAASFAVSAASLALIRRPFRAERTAKPRGGLLADIRDGVAFVWRHSALRAIVGYWSVVSLATAAILPTLTFYVTVDRGMGPELFGVVGSAWSAGYLAGSLAAGRLTRGRVGLSLLGSGALIGASLIAIAVTPEPLVWLGAAFLVGGSLAVVLISFVTLRALVTPDELLGRVGSTTRTVMLGVQPLGMLGGGALIAATNGTVTLATMGAIAVGATLVFTFCRGLRTASADAH